MADNFLKIKRGLKPPKILSSENGLRPLNTPSIHCGLASITKHNDQQNTRFGHGKRGRPGFEPGGPGLVRHMRPARGSPVKIRL